MKFSSTDKMIKAEGRVLTDKNIRYLNWSGSNISFSFTGKKAEATLVSDAGAFGDTQLAQLQVFVDGEAAKRFRLEEKEQKVVLYEAESAKTVTIKLMKLSEAAFSYCGIKEIETDADELLPVNCTKTRKIEIIGDSITCGYGVEAGNELEHFTTDTENPTKSYSLLLANALNAEVNLVCWSGNGLISHYVDPEATEPSLGMLMPEIYNYTDLSLSKRLYGEDESKWEKWNFESYEPELIFINLGTNDCSWCREIAERNEEFKATYMEFLKNIRKNNKNAKIVSMLGMMDTRLAKALPEAVEAYRNESGDRQVFYLELPLQLPDIDGYGADYHPSPSTHVKTRDYILSKLNY